MEKHVWYSLIIILYVAYVFLTLFSHWETAHRGVLLQLGVGTSEVAGIRLVIILPRTAVLFGFCILLKCGECCGSIYLPVGLMMNTTNLLTHSHSQCSNDITFMTVHGVRCLSYIEVSDHPFHKLQCTKFMHSHKACVGLCGVRMRFSCVYSSLCQIFNITPRCVNVF